MCLCRRSDHDPDATSRTPHPALSSPKTWQYRAQPEEAPFTVSVVGDGVVVVVLLVFFDGTLVVTRFGEISKISVGEMPR